MPASDDDLDWHEVRRIVAMMNKRGHASEFARETTEDRRVIQKLTAQDWANAVASKFGLLVTGVTSGEQDPPDCVASCQDRNISIELTEMVNSKILKAIARARRTGRTISASDELFDAAQWTADLLRQRLCELLDQKQESYTRRNLGFDVLIIHSAEMWLSPYQVEQWLSAFNFAPRTGFKNAYLLLRYFPGYADHWPVFKLF